MMIQKNLSSKESFMDLYTKIDAGVEIDGGEEAYSEDAVPTDDEDHPF